MTVELPQMPILRQTPLNPPLEYDELREHEGVSRVRFPSGRVGWLVTRFDEASQVFSDPRMSAQRPSYESASGEEAGAEEAPADSGGADPTFVFMDEPEHGAYRRLLAGRFTPKSVAERVQPYLGRVLEEALDAMAAAPQPVDIVEYISLPIPCLVICELLGVPYSDRDGFHEATVVLMDAGKTQQERNVGAQWLIQYIAGLVSALRADPQSQGLLAELIRGQEAGSILTDHDLISIGVLLLFAGHDTTMANISLATLTLLTHPRQRAELIEAPEKLGPAVEELLRFLTTVQYGLGRVAKEDLELGGQQIAAGDLVVVSMAAANRDPRVFDNPDLPDFDRAMIRHLAFGYGVHQCLGQNVARAELKTVLPRLFARFPDMRLAIPVEDLEMDSLANNYSVKSLPVTW